MIDMSTLEKAIGMLNSLPESDIELVYTFIQFVNEKNQKETKKINNIDSILNSITGSLPDSGMTAEDYRYERLSERYEIDD